MLCATLASCSTDSKQDDFKMTITHEADKNIVTYRNGPTMELAQGARVVNNFNMTEMSVSLHVEALNYAPGKVATLDLPLMRVSQGTDGIYTASLVEANVGGFTCTDFQYTMALMTNGYGQVYVASWGLTGSIDGNRFRLFPSNDTFYGITNTLPTEGQPFTTNQCIYGIDYDRNSRTATVQIYNPAFASGMVGKIELIRAAGIPFTISDLGIRLATESVIPDMKSGTSANPQWTPMPSFTMNSFAANLVFGKSFTLTFTCDLPNAGGLNTVNFTGTYFPIANEK